MASRNRHRQCTVSNTTTKIAFAIRIERRVALSFVPTRRTLINSCASPALFGILYLNNIVYWRLSSHIHFPMCARCDLCWAVLFLLLLLLLWSSVLFIVFCCILFPFLFSIRLLCGIFIFLFCFVLIAMIAMVRYDSEWRAQFLVLFWHWLIQGRHLYEA